MSNVVKIVALGGLDENGKNMYVIEVNDDILVFDCGMRYPDISHLGVDIVLPDYSYLRENKNKIRGYFISHGHDDNMGAISYIANELPAPIYATELTIHMINEVIKRYRHQKRNFDFKVIGREDIFNVGKVTVRAFPTTHSIGDSVGFVVETVDGSIVYTGDYVFDFASLPHYNSNLNLLAEIASKKVLCLMGESGNALVNSFTSPHHHLTPHISAIFKDHDGRIIVAIYSQNLFAIREVIELALKTERKIMFINKEMHNTIEKLIELDMLDLPNHCIATNIKERNAVIVVSNQGKALFKNLQKMIFGSDNNFTDTYEMHKNDSFIIAAKAVPGVEIIASRAIDDLYRAGVNVFQVNQKKLFSMHAGREDIKMMFSILKPKYYMPVKGEYRQLVANASIALSLGYNHSNILVYDNGMIAEFIDGELNTNIVSIPVGDTLVDGVGVGDVADVVLNDRNKLADDGVLILGLAVDVQKEEIVSVANVQMRGLIFIKESDYVCKDIATIFEKLVQNNLKKMKNNEIDSNTLKNEIIEAILKYVKKETGKKPMILPVIVQI